MVRRSVQLERGRAQRRCLLPDRLLGVALTLGVVQNPIFDLESDQA